MPGFADARWYEVRPAANRKPATYRCPFCDELLPALAPHQLVSPEGDRQRRRHAHTACVMEARRAGRLPLRDEVEPPRRGSGGLSWLVGLIDPRDTRLRRR